MTALGEVADDFGGGADDVIREKKEELIEAVFYVSDFEIYISKSET